MSNAPYFYDYANAAGNVVTPSIAKISGTAISIFFRKYLLQKAMSVFTFEIPEEWDKDYFLYTLYEEGRLAVVNTPEFGVVPQGCTLSGYNLYFRPRFARVVNPLLRSLPQQEIGRDCTVIHLMPNYNGIMDLVNYYGDMMALTASTAATNIRAAMFAYIFTAENKAGAEALKKAFDKIESGELMAVVDKKVASIDDKPAWDLFTQNVGANYIAGDLLADMRKWEERFDTEVGIPSANTDKRERLITDEVNSNNVETASKASLWMDTLKKSIDQTNKMFGLSISVDWRNKPETGETEESEADDNESNA